MLYVHDCTSLLIINCCVLLALAHLIMLRSMIITHTNILYLHDGNSMKSGIIFAFTCHVIYFPHKPKIQENACIIMHCTLELTILDRFQAQLHIHHSWTYGSPHYLAMLALMVPTNLFQNPQAQIACPLPMLNDAKAITCCY